MSLTKPKQMCPVHRCRIFYRSRCICYLELNSVSWGYRSSEIFCCLPMTHWIHQRERCNISIYPTDNMPALLVKPYFIIQGLWLVLSHQRSKIVAANRSAKQRWAYIWMFFNALTVMWSTTNMQKSSGAGQKKKHSHKRIKVCAKHGSSLFSQWVTLRRKLSRPCNWCPAVFWGGWLVGWWWGKEWEGIPVQGGRGESGLGLGLWGVSTQKMQSCWGQTVWLSLRYSGVHEHQRQRQ